MGAEKQRPPPPAPCGALPLPTAPHSTPLFPTVNYENISSTPRSVGNPQVRGGGAEWGAADPRAPPLYTTPWAGTLPEPPVKEGSEAPAGHLGRRVERSGASGRAVKVISVQHNGSRSP
ncbi:hypothetical protein GCM10010191_15080 [Actinomadura vinacea]|uniref:Uncharacterized protein n=1 Tax=Actinomadura vinacea TaxID=115336 RepID=A0ABN3IKV5_9ACTN